MRSTHPILSSSIRHRLPICGALALLVASTAAQAEVVRKADNTDNLDQASSWIANGPPDALDIAQWDNAVLGANSTLLGSTQTWLGINILDPGGAVTIGGAPEFLILGSGGIDMSDATQNLTISAPVQLGAAQTWSVGAGRVLSITAEGTGAISGAGPLAIEGPGRVQLGGLAATYTFTGGISLSGGNGLNSVAATGSNANSANTNLLINAALIKPVASNTGTNVNLPTFTAAGGAVHTTGAAGSSGQIATIVSFGLVVAPGQTNFTMQRGGSGRVIYTFSGTPTRQVGGTLNLRDDIAGNGTNNNNGGGYRLSAAANVNGVVPYITYTTTSTNTSWFSSHSTGTSTNGSAFSAFTSSTDTSLGTATQNSTVVTDVSLTNPLDATVNTVRFNDGTSRTVTIGPEVALTVAAGGILVTNNGTANQTITGGTLMGGNPGSGSGNDLIIHQVNNTSTFTIGSVIADNATTNPGATGLTKSGAGVLAITGTNTYTGPTTVNAGTLLVNGSISGTSALTVKYGGTVGGTGTINGAVTIEEGGRTAPGAGIGELDGTSWVWSSNDFTAGMLFELGADTASSDRLALTGAFNKGTGTSFLFDLTGGVVGQTYDLVNFASTTFSASDFDVSNVGVEGNFSLTGGPSAPGTLQFTVIPEPGSFVTMLAAAGMVAGFRRRRR